MSEEKTESGTRSLPLAGAVACCAPPADADEPTGDALHDNLRALLTRYNVNDYAASVKVFAVKPAAHASPV